LVSRRLSIVAMAGLSVGLGTGELSIGWGTGEISKGLDTGVLKTGLDAGELSIDVGSMSGGLT
jgi:hypothetical protein